MTTENGHDLAWVHFGDLHITEERLPNYAALLGAVEEVNTHLAGGIDFCVLPGDNADDGTAEEYALIERALRGLRVPLHVIPGDHDCKQGDLQAFYRTLGVEMLPKRVTAGGHRCLFLDVVSCGSGGPDFRLGARQLEWLEQELRAADLAHAPVVVFMHCYPAELHEAAMVAALFGRHRVRVVDMGHTHYNEVANDGTTLYTTTRSTGQIEEGPVGFSITTLQGGVANWRFKPLESAWPFVMITSPADHRLLTTATPECAASEPLTISARAWSRTPVTACRCRIDEGPWQPMQPGAPTRWSARSPGRPRRFALTVEAIDDTGAAGSDTLIVAEPGYVPPARTADGSDADAVGAWAERHLLGSRLGPNRNGRQW